MPSRSELLQHAANLERYRRLLWMDLNEAERRRVEQLFAEERAILRSMQGAEL